MDELGECGPEVQAKLLRVIQEKELQSLGSVRTKKVDVRFFAATNRDLDSMTKEGTFRLDLLQRLNTFPIRIPPLRERSEDIVFYTNHFLAESLQNRPFTVTSCGMDSLLAYSWPGNVRELRNIIERIVLMADNRTIDGKVVSEAFNLDAGRRERQSLAGKPPNDKRSEILSVLELENGNRTRAAARIGVHPVTFQRWLKKFGIADVFAAQPGRPSIMRQALVQEEKEAKA